MRSSSLACFLIAAPLFSQNWQTALPGYRFQFPRDHFSHPEYQTEWWYYTGNLRSTAGHRYGFELTFFRQATSLSAAAANSEDPTWRPDQIYLAHLALSDIDGQKFYHAERLNRAGPGLAGAGLRDARYWNGNWQVQWTSLPDQQQNLQAVCDDFTLRLTLDPGKPPVIQGKDGISRKGPAPGQASHYISFTRLNAAGEISGRNFKAMVDGLAWMDHEFFTEPPASDIEGWDWFAIQLDNNQELMLYRLRNRSGKPDPYSSGSYVDASGHSRFLSAGEFSLTPGDMWTSDHSRAHYPVAWHISVPSLGLELDERTDLRDQELSDRTGNSSSYWEGAVAYSGTVHGQKIGGVGYLEMTGYGKAIQLSGLAK